MHLQCTIRCFGLNVPLTVAYFQHIPVRCVHMQTFIVAADFQNKLIQTFTASSKMCHLAISNLLQYYFQVSCYSSFENA